MENEMMLNQYPAIDMQENGSNGSFTLVLGFIRRFFLLILIFTLLGVGAGTGFAFKKDKTIYTQTKSVILLAKIDGSAQTTNLTLTKKYISTVKGIITTPKFINAANEIYEGVSAGAITVEEGGGMILKISYSDTNAAEATKKLDAFIEAAHDVILNGGLSDNSGLITADEVDFKPIDNVPVKTSSNGFVKYVLLGLIGGFAIGIALALLIYLLDNAVRSREDVERLTGSTVIAYLDDVGRSKK